MTFLGHKYTIPTLNMVEQKVHEGGERLSMEEEFHDKLISVSERVYRRGVPHKVTEKVCPVVAEEMATAIYFDCENADRRKIRSIVTEACRHACSLFVPCFPGSNDPESQNYNTAVQNTCLNLCDYLPGVLEAAGLDPELSSTIGKADFNDLVAIAAKKVGVPTQEMKSVEEVKKEILKNLGHEPDMFEMRVLGNIKVDSIPPTEEEEEAIVIAMRLANAKWKVTQPFRALKEGHPGRIRRQNFTTFNTMVTNYYYKWDGNLIMSAFELLKDWQEVDRSWNTRKSSAN